MSIAALFLTVFLGLVSFFLGKWRWGCVVNASRLETEMNVPPAWHMPLVRYGTLLVSMCLTVLFAHCGATFLEPTTPYEYSFYGLALARYFGSGFAAIPQHIATRNEFLEGEDPEEWKRIAAARKQLQKLASGR